MRIPARHKPTAAILAKYGPTRLDRLGALLLDGDPLADAAVAAFVGLPRDVSDRLVDRALRGGVASVGAEMPAEARPLFEQVETVPFWFDRARSERGGNAFLRSGVFGGLVLAAKSIVGGYCSPSGNKPLAFSGRLERDIPRRLLETSRYVQAVSLPGGLDVHAEGYVASVKVRLLHASIRRMLLAAPVWNMDWGVPINQLDMAGTALLFSAVAVEGLDDLGVHLSSEEREDFQHLWRYAGWLMGVSDELLCTSFAEGLALMEMIRETQDPPDADSRRLASALFDAPVRMARTDAERARGRRMSRFMYGLSRHLLGDAYADALGYPKTKWRFALPALRRAGALVDPLRRTIPGLDALSLAWGERHWEKASNPPGAAPVTFPMASHLPHG